jgi:FkbM family methyltransferase
MKSGMSANAFFGAIVAVMAAAACCRGDDGACNCPSTRYENGNYYSQYYEDYILAYVFKGVKKGFYIDVGANDPMIANITMLFYQQGWNGMNIEPNVEKFKKLVNGRPRDSNYNCGIADREGSMTFYLETDSGSAGLSTFDKEDAAQLQKGKKASFKEVRVPVTTLNRLLARMLPQPEITFISIDVEGFEKQVIESIDLGKYKPIVLCIEATKPLSDDPAYQAWEGLLLKNNYLFAMFDGLNRYYVQKNHSDLLLRFIDIDRCVKINKNKRKVKLDGWGSRE